MNAQRSAAPPGQPHRRKGSTTVAEFAEAELRSMALSGQLVPGKRINEVAVAASLGISRGPLREAIQRLASEGLLSIVRHKGAYVRTVDGAELEELYELRIVLETFAVRAVIAKAGADELAELSALVRRTRQILDEDATAYPADLDFHLQLVALARQSVLQRAVRDVHSTIHLARARSAHDPDRARAALDEHTRILDAVIARDAGLATQLLDQHLRTSLHNARTLLAT
jgi:DNA-binding GntR family transcriptional regulator